MSSPMTLREAVEITRVERAAYTDSCLALAEPSSRRDRLKTYNEACAKWHHARAIVDAAVEAHEALTKYADLPSISAIHDQFGAKNKWMNTVDKLRALERGQESEVQQ